MDKKLKIGDTVNWRNAWGKDAPQDAVIESIDVHCNGTKHGKARVEVLWANVNRSNVVVNLTNGSWAYGNQITPK
jgi:hypothetical protein